MSTSLRGLTLLPLTLLGCGASSGATTVESAPVEHTEGSTVEPAVAQAPPEVIEWLSSEEVRCVRGGPEPEGALLAGDGARIAVRAHTISFERDPGERIVCEAGEGVTGQPVLVLAPYDGLSIGMLEGDRLRIGGYPVDIVRLPGATSIAAAREVHYCPQGLRGCIIAGGLEAVEAYADADPNAPRSGWDLSVRRLSPTRRRRAGTEWLTERACGLEVGLRGAPRGLECEGSTLAQRLSCAAADAQQRMDALYGADSDEERAQLRVAYERDAVAFQLVLADDRQEVTLPAFDVAALACVEGHVLARARTEEFSSERAYGAIALREGLIASGHWMSIRDHEEERSDCGNAWDGVQLVPVLREGAVIGGIVLGAGGRPLFEVERGDVGDVRTPAFWAGEHGAPPREIEEAAFAYGDEEVPLALRETQEGLMAIASTPAPSCSLVVDDTDGQTNVRADPSTRREPVGTVANGTVITPAEQRGRWYRIETPVRGWLFAANLDRRCGAP